MRILTLHSDSLEVEPKIKALKEAEAVEEGQRQKFGEALVVFSAVEARDEVNALAVAQRAAEEIVSVCDQIKVRRVVLYPFVHLTSTPSKPSTARAVLGSVENILKGKGFEVGHAPFGWYKQFSISVKGHPLAELSREITAESAIKATSKQEESLSGALKEEEKVKSEWFILTPDGKAVPVKDFDFKGNANLEKFYRYEAAKVRTVTEEPPHVKFMRKLELVDYEPGSDPGNLRFYPKGRLIKALLEDWITRKMIAYGGMEVETPIMYDYEHPAFRSYLNRFPARHYVIESAKKKFFLRFSACFGQFLQAVDSTISYKDLPLKWYELTRYSFRLEQAGELVGLRRLRAFTMPDMHTLCRDMDEAKEEFKRQFRLWMAALDELGLSSKDYETAIRFTKEFWNQHKDFVVSLVKLLGRPALIEMWDRRYAYFDPKFEFNIIDLNNRAAALSTVQLDHENAERYGIKYMDKDNTQKSPLILHSSVGAIERLMFAIIEKALIDSPDGKNAVLPLWLSPIQVRLCPLNETFNKLCEKIAADLEREGVRVDVDDRVESVQKKIRDAEIEWVPLIVVVGDKEKKSKKLAVRFRKTAKVKAMTTAQLLSAIKKETKGLPTRPLSLPKLLSRRPKFRA